jgi:hypothetical protein
MNQLERFKKKDNSSRDYALGAGLATTGALATRHTLRDIVNEAAERKLVPGTKRWDEFISKLEPGDLLFSKVNKTNADSGYIKNVLQVGTGSPYYHASMYTGKGDIFEAPGGDFKSDYYSGKKEMGRNRDIVAYRPNVSEKSRAKAAIETPKALKGFKYMDDSDTLKMGLNNLFVPGAGGCVKTDKGVVCTTVPQHAYKGLFNAATNVEEMQRHPNMEMVARLEKKAPGMLDRFLTRGVYPVLKNLKWGLAAGGAGYLGKKMYDNFTEQ